jgi:membrane-associated phospholipid phosphatase
LVIVVVAWPAILQAQSVTSLFTGLPGDFKNMATLSSIAVVGAGGAAGAIVHPEDRDIASRARRSIHLEEFLDAGNLAGNGAVQVGTALTVYAVGRVARSRATARYGADLVRAQFVSGIITDGLKVAVRRRRPDGGRYSFPSGHTASAFATAAVTYRHFGPKAGIPAFVLASYIGSSRVTDFKHFPSDVLFGAAVGIAAGRAVSVHHRDVTVSPFINRRAFGVVARF